MDIYYQLIYSFFTRAIVMQLFLSLLLLGVLGFLAFFLVGTMAALKWFDSEDPEPRAIKLGEYRDRENPLKQVN